MFARLLLIAVVAAVILAAVARTSSGGGPARTYVVRPGDTLWSIAAKAYDGDPRDGVWRIRDRNALGSSPLVVGERLVLP
jgi:hypothetical protein